MKKNNNKILFYCKDKNLIKKARAYAEMKGLSLSWVIREALADYLYRTHKSINNKK